MLEKTCCRCKQIKPALEFHKNKTRKDGLQGRCKECQKYKNISETEQMQRVKAVMKHRQTEDGKQQHRDANKRYHKTEKGKEVHDKAFKKWAASERGRKNINFRSNKYQTKRYHSDPEYYKLKHKSWLYGVPLGILQQIIERDKVCQLCKSTKDLQFDHIHPVSMGGKGSLENLQLLCSICNNFKSNNLFLPDGGMIVTT